MDVVFRFLSLPDSPRFVQLPPLSHSPWQLPPQLAFPKVIAQKKKREKKRNQQRLVLPNSRSRSAAWAEAGGNRCPPSSQASCCWIVVFLLPAQTPHPVGLCRAPTAPSRSSVAEQPNIPQTWGLLGIRVHQTLLGCWDGSAAHQHQQDLSIGPQGEQWPRCGEEPRHTE